MKLAIVILLGIVVSCGRNTSGDNCRNKEHMRIVCVNERTPNYGYQYSVDSCNKEYSYDRCY